MPRPPSDLVTLAERRPSPPPCGEDRAEADWTVRVVPSLRHIDPDDWKALFPSSPYGYGFFQTMEETLARQFTFSYIVISRASRLVCLAPCFVTDYSLDTTIAGSWKTATSWVKKIASRLLTLRVMACGSPMETGQLGLADAELLPTIVPRLIEAMQAVARRERASLLAFKDFSPSDAPLVRLLRDLGFHWMPSYAAAALDIPFASFEAYLASLSKATRKDLRRKFKKSESLRIELEVRHDLGAAAEEAYRLYLNTFERSHTKFELVTKEFFERISTRLPGETTYFLWRLEGRLIAFDLCLVSGSTLFDEYLGMDYDVAYRYHLYYLTFRDILTWCIQHGIRRYAGGLMNYDPKKRLDFTLTPQVIYFKHRHRLLHHAFRLVGRLVNPENFDPSLKSLAHAPGHAADRRRVPSERSRAAAAPRRDPRT